MKIKFKNLNKHYKMFEDDVVALNNVTGDISENVTVILGPSGSGKSTLLNMIGLIDNLDSGEIIIDDKNVTKLSPVEKTEFIQEKIGFIFQSYNLINNLTVLENILIGTHQKVDKNHLNEIIDTLELNKLLDKFPAELSGGQQQRVAIARALLKKPELILCDEPTGALDEKTAKNVLNLLFKNSVENNIKLIIVTHEPAIAKVSDEVIVFRSGKIAEKTKNKQKINITDLEF